MLNNEKNCVFSMLLCFAYIYMLIYISISFKSILLGNAQEPQAPPIRGEHFNQNCFQHSMALFTIPERVLK